MVLRHEPCGTKRAPENDGRFGDDLGTVGFGWYSNLLDVDEEMAVHCVGKSDSVAYHVDSSPGERRSAVFFWECCWVGEAAIGMVEGRLDVHTLRVCEYEDLWREGARDAKTLAA